MRRSRPWAYQEQEACASEPSAHGHHPVSSPSGKDTAARFDDGVSQGRAAGTATRLPARRRADRLSIARRERWARRSRGSPTRQRLHSEHTAAAAARPFPSVSLHASLDGDRANSAAAPTTCSPARSFVRAGGRRDWHSISPRFTRQGQSPLRHGLGGLLPSSCFIASYRQRARRFVSRISCDGDNAISPPRRDVSSPAHASIRS